MRKLLITQCKAVGALLFFVSMSLSVAANANYDTAVEYYIQSAVVNEGDEFTVNVHLYSSSASTSTVYNPKAALTDLAGFTVKNISSFTTPSTCSFSSFSAWCSVNSLAPGNELVVVVTLQATTAGVYELTATGTPSGFNSDNNVQSIPITVNSPPEVTVDEPSDESWFSAGSQVALTATALDGEDGDVSSQISWWSNLMGPLGTGATSSTALSNGRHSITAEVTDSSGVSNSKLFQVTVDAIPENLPTIRTIAGNDTSGYSGDGGLASAATFGVLRGVTRTPQGFTYIVDHGNGSIRRIDPYGIVTTVYTGQLYSNISAITSDVWGNVYWANNNADDIKKLTPDGILSTAAGGGMVHPKEGFAAGNVYFDNVSDLAVNELGEIFIVVPFRHQVYRIGTDNMVHIAAGNGVNNFYPTFGSPATDSPVSYPSHIALDATGNLYISQNNQNFDRVFKVDTAGDLTLYAGSGARGFAGDFGPATDALLSYPTDLLVDQNGELLILDYGNRRIRRVTADGTITTVYGNGDHAATGDGGFAAEAGLGTIADLDVADNGDLLIASGYQVRLISPDSFDVDLALSAQGGAIAQQDGTVDILYTLSNTVNKPVENVFLTLTSDTAISTTGVAGETCTPTSGTQIKCHIENLATNASVEVQAQANADMVGDYSVAASLSSYFNELTPSDNTVTFNYSVNAKPLLTVVSPVSGDSYLQTSLVELSATGTDAEDGSLNATIDWTSSIDGFLGQGEQLFVNLSSGVHTIVATVVDSGGASAQRQVNITVDVVNTPPAIAIVSPADQSSISVDGGPIVFDVNVTDSEDGNVSSEVTLQSSIDGAFTSPAMLSVGTHTITAAVTDSGGLSATDSISVTITPHVNAAPQIAIVSPASGGSFTVNDAVVFDVNASDAEDGELSSQAVLQSSIDGAIESPAVLSEGTHTITASVTDSAGLSATSSIILTITPYVNTAPQLSVSSPLNGQTVSKSEAVILAAEATDAEDGDLSSAVTWVSSIDGAVVSPVQLSVGTHTLTASVSDSDGSTDSASVEITVTDAVSYCSSRGNTSSYEWAAAIGIAGDNYTSGNNGGYLDATGTVFSVQSGSAVPLVLTPGYRSSSYNEYWAVWIDFNRNGAFEAGERVYSGSGSAIVNGNIAIPVTAQAGQTRMRISMKYGSTPQPCETFSYGEVEDYSVDIQPGVAYQLSGTSDHVITRSGAAGNDVVWVVEEDGVIVFSGTADGSLSFQYVGHQVGSVYRIWLRNPVDLEAISNVVTYTFEDDEVPVLPAVCASNGNNANYEWINSVTFGAYVNHSGKNNGYLDMTATAAVQADSLSVPITLQPGGNYSEYWAIWIDINRDGQFTTDEHIYTHSGSSSVSATVNIPAAVTTGRYRMRVTMKYGGTPPACGSFTYGEVEDYLIEFSL